MSKKQTNVLTSDLTRAQMDDLAVWWGLEWGERPHYTAVIRQAIERVWTEERVRRENGDNDE